MFERVRRFLLFQAWIIWQGGFVFYAAVVVPVGSDVLGSATIQGFVTREVTNWLNALGVAYHLLLAWNLAADRGIRHRRTRFGLGATSAILLLALLILHPVLDSFLDAVEQTVREPKAFYRWHIVYLWCSTVQWLLALVQAWLMISGASRRARPIPGIAA